MSMVRYLAARAKNSGMFAMARMRGGYSHFGQDLWVVQRLQEMRGGFFVDLGAYTPIVASNTYLLERRYGWNGICIEANPLLLEKLQNKRRCTCIQACVSGRVETVDFLADGGPWGGIVEHYPKGHIETLLRYLPSDRVQESGQLKTRKMQTVLLADILDAQNAPSVIDYMSIDVEGAEFSILQTFPFNRYNIRTLTVEHNSRPEYRRHINELLSSRGYRLDKAGSLDDFYCHDSL